MWECNSSQPVPVMQCDMGYDSMSEVSVYECAGNGGFSMGLQVYGTELTDSVKLGSFSRNCTTQYAS